MLQRAYSLPRAGCLGMTFTMAPVFSVVDVFHSGGEFALLGSAAALLSYGVGYLIALLVEDVFN